MVNANGIFGKLWHAIFAIVATLVFVVGATGAAVAACATNEIDVLGDGTQCETSKFELTTTSLARNTIFKFSLSAKGDFYVDWGDGSAVQTITRSNTTATDYTHTYTTAGVKTIRFGGTATGYNTSTSTAAITFYKSSGGSQTKIASISGSLSAIFPYISGNAAGGAQPRFNQTFRGATQLTTVPATLFADYTTGASNMFSATFSGCTGLTSVPAGLFSGITTGASNMFSSTFYGCTSLASIPSGLFSGITTGASNMFSSTFYGCTSLASIPANLFGGITSGAMQMFNSTFYGCTSLASIPAGLFSGITTSASSMFAYTFNGCTGLTSIPMGLFSGITTGADNMFSNTFDGCTNLGGYIPPDTFAGLIAAGAQPGTNMWQNTFNNTQLVTSCPTGTAQYITGYEGTTSNTWNGKVSCGCEAGYWGDGTTCTACSNTIPAHSSYTTGATNATCPWVCDSDYVSNGTSCVAPTFSVTTTTLNANDTFTFSLSTVGTFYVNWGDGTENTIIRTDTSSTNYTHTYSSAGTYTIGFGGTATGYNTSISTAAISFSGNTKIASVSGSLSAMFPYISGNAADGAQPRFYQTFRGATQLTTVPATLFANYATGATSMFSYTFSGCTGLTSIPAGLFSGITTAAGGMFNNTFNGCTSLTSIPAGLFSGMTTGAQSLFSGTFYGCTGLTTVPEGLFSGITTAASSMFRETFRGCTGLTSIPTLFGNISGGADYMFDGTFEQCTNLATIPETLFSGITTGASYMFEQTFSSCSSLQVLPSFANITTGVANTFYYTFYSCPNLSGYIPPTMFAGLIAAGAPANTFNSTFQNSYTLVSVCPAGTTQYVTGFEGRWNNRVSCQPCPAGTYKDVAGNEACSACPVGTYMAGTGATECDACTNGPANSTYTSGGATNTCAWACDSGYLNTGTSCETEKFSVTTRSNATTLIWTMSATGEFYVDCGDGGTLTQSGTTTGSTISGNTITRTGTSNTTYTCTWGSSGAHTVRFGGTATGYNTSTSVPTISFYQFSGGTQAKVASVSGSLGAMFPVVNGNIPRFYQTFYGCSNLTSIPADLFSGIDTSSATDTSNMFDYTFRGSGITSLPAGLFGGIDTSSATNTSSMFRGTFHTCSNLRSLPADLFSAIDTSSATNTSQMFQNTFYGCTNLSSIPAGLFSAIDTTSATNTSYMFDDTFYGCTNLTSIPADLFSAVDTSSATDMHTMFQSTFSNCSNLGSIPAGLFSAIDTSSATNTSYMFSGTFYNTGITSIPAGLFSAIDTSSATDTSRMFQSTFNGCSNLTGYIPPTTFPNTIQPGSSSSSNMWYRTFYNTQLLTACPVGTTQYITGFESDWGYSNGNVPTDNGSTRVSCEPCPGTLPEHASYTTAGTCNWTCDSGYMNTGTSCEESKFSVTTTTDATTLSWTMTAKGTFYVDCGDGGTLTQSGATGSTISGNTITRTRTGTGTPTYTCRWNSAGAHTVRFGGTATGYSTSTSDAAIAFYKSSGGTQSKVASISGSLGAMFPVVNGNIPRFYSTFYNCTRLTSIPTNLFSGIDTSSATDTSHMFNGTFNNTGITSIPAGLFSGIDTSSATNTSEMFVDTFRGTGITSIPVGLFSTIDTSSATNTRWMFLNTFYDTGITSIPAGLFSTIDTSSATDTSAMFASTFANTGLTSIPAGLFSTIDTSSATDTSNIFDSTFSGCGSLTSIPAGLFSTIDTSSATVTSNMFYQTFYDCSNLGGYIPPTTFPNTIRKGTSSSARMWQDTFAGTNIATSCDDFPGMTQYITGFESEWGYSNNNVPTDDGSTRVSCQPCADAGMPEYNNKCHAYCSAMSVLHAGNYEYPLVSDRTGVPAPVLTLKKNDDVCYLYMEQDDNLNIPGLHIRYDNHTYSAVSLVQPG